MPYNPQRPTYSSSLETLPVSTRASGVSNRAYGHAPDPQPPALSSPTLHLRRTVPADTPDNIARALELSPYTATLSPRPLELGTPTYVSPRAQRPPPIDTRLPEPSDAESGSRDSVTKKSLVSLQDQDRIAPFVGDVVADASITELGDKQSRKAVWFMGDPNRGLPEVPPLLVSKSTHTEQDHAHIRHRL